METIQFVLMILLWVMCRLLVLLVLVQGGTGDVASSFGGGGQLDSSLGVGASKKMAKLTGVLSVVFLISVLIISIPVEKTAESYGLEEAAAPAATTTPVTTTSQPVPEADAAPAPVVDVAPAAEVEADAETTVNAGATADEAPAQPAQEEPAEAPAAAPAE